MSQTTIIPCKNCGNRMSVSEQNLGKKARCPKCMSILILTAPGQKPAHASDTVLEEDVTQAVDMTPKTDQDTIIEEHPTETVEVQITDSSAQDTVTDDDTAVPTVIEVPSEPAPVELQDTIVEPAPPSSQDTLIEKDSSTPVVVDLSTTPTGQETFIEEPSTVEVEIPKETEETSAHATVVDEDEPAPSTDTSSSETFVEPEPVVIADLHAHETEHEAELLLPGTREPGAPETLTGEPSSVTQTAMVEATVEAPPKRPRRKAGPSIAEVKERRQKKSTLILKTLAGLLGLILFTALVIYLTGVFDTPQMKLKAAFTRFMADLERAQATTDLLPHVNTDNPFQKQEAEKMFRKWIDRNRISFHRIKIKEGGIVVAGAYGHVVYDVEFFMDDKTSKRGTDPDLGASGATQEIRPYRAEMTSYWINVRGRWTLDTQKYETKRMVEEYRDVMGPPKMTPVYQKHCPVCLEKSLN